MPESSLFRTALRWMPTFLGFPAGGLAAELITGRVDAFGPAIAGGALTGTILGVAQWLAIRRTGPAALPWTIATGVGCAAGLGAGASLVGYHTNIGALAAQGALSGLAIGITQAAVLRPLLGRIVLAWPVVLAGLWALGWTITSAAGIDVDAEYTVFGSSGAIVVTAATSVLAVLLDRHRP